MPGPILKNGFVSLLTIASLFSRAKGQDDCAIDSRSTRAITVADAICMTKLGDYDYSVWGASSRGRVAQFSPDGKKFIVVFRKGNLQTNNNDYSVLLWKSEEAFHSAAPEVLLTMSSSSNRPAIQKLRWLPDNETVLFLGETPGEEAQIYTFNVPQ